MKYAEVERFIDYFTKTILKHFKRILLRNIIGNQRSCPTNLELLDVKTFVSKTLK